MKRMVRDYLWRTNKFIKDEAKAEELIEELLDNCPALNKGMTDEEKEAWCIEFQGFLCKTFNGQRTETGNGIKSSLDLWRAQGWDRKTGVNNIPSVSDFQRCVYRDVDLTISDLPDTANPDDPTNILQYSPDGRLFWWYCEHVLAKTSGLKMFGPTIRNYHRISAAPWYMDQTGTYMHFLRVAT